MSTPPGWPDDVRERQGRLLFPIEVWQRSRGGERRQVRVGLQLLFQTEILDIECRVISEFVARRPEFDPDKAPAKFALVESSVRQLQQVETVARSLYEWDPPHAPWATVESIWALLQQKCWSMETVDHIIEQINQCHAWVDPRDQTIDPAEAMAAAMKLSTGSMSPLVDTAIGASREAIIQSVAELATESPRWIAWLSSQPTSVQDWYRLRRLRTSSGAT